MLPAIPAPTKAQTATPASNTKMKDARSLAHRSLMSGACLVLGGWCLALLFPSFSTTQSPNRHTSEQYKNEGREISCASELDVWSLSGAWRLVFGAFISVVFHHTGNNNTEINMLPAIPTAHTTPRLAIPALLDHASEPKPAMAVAPHNNSARPTDRYAIARSPL